MDVINIPTKFKLKEIKNLEELKKHLPKKFILVSITQYNDYAKYIYNNLKNDYNIVIKPELYEINVLGCYSEPANLEGIDTVLLIGNGKFHAENIIRNLVKRTIVYDPIYGEINIYEPDYNYKKSIDYLLVKLKNSNNIGIILSIKPGQYYYLETLKVKEKLEKDGKNVYLFIGDTIDILQLLNFPYIDFWIFSACPRIIDDIIRNNLNGLTIDIVMKNLEKSTNI
ncbi:2-(3-amino-3-carboxypropyl)histidine synthase [Nanobdella aerobiophila]|uniref:2-(3-amino-3-carboxypropyl)histidine synthase n=1 Tax=Nanobdella aerobiophila TaxID=2586965 RepID=A0A915SII4_9ARCH|nr:2-(3-amino-3-carboxypropyl)histidine synthase subunit [Nanobdella aerobiophila]BBL45662.1 2-(3-amino-3-carboxypropyl)histidine synthase [Nanobdella aerobiophila]